MPDSATGDDGIPSSPLRAAVLTFVVDADGLEYVRRMISVMQQRYRMTYDRAVDELNVRLGAREGRAPAVILRDAPESWVWWHETPEHVVRQMFEGGYWVREQKVRAKVREWESGQEHGKAIHEHLGWTPEAYARWIEDGTLPPPSTTDLWEL
jgi:broad specificity phosphatase PhoE